jgi:hypothetical protein
MPSRCVRPPVQMQQVVWEVSGAGRQAGAVLDAGSRHREEAGRQHGAARAGGGPAVVLPSKRDSTSEQQLVQHTQCGGSSTTHNQVVS